MAKKTFYFPHDGNARNDDKLVAVRMKHGMSGYGIYFALLEKLLESSEYELLKDYNIIAYEMRVSSELVKSVVEDFGLFQFKKIDDKAYFYSKSFIERMTPLDNLRDQRIKAGKKSAEKRTSKKDISTTVVENVNDRCQKKQQSKESNINKEKIYKKENEDLDFHEMLKADDQWKEQTEMVLSIPRGTINPILKTFFEECNIKGDTHDYLQDAKRHFVNWYKLNKNKIKDETKQTQFKPHPALLD